MLAGLKAIDKELYDAAAVDGANAWRRFLHVTLPGLRYVIIVAVLLSTIFTFNSFTLTYLLTGGGPGGATRVYAILAYEYAIQALRTSAGVAVAMTVAPFLFILILVLGRYMMRREDLAHSSSRRRRGLARVHDRPVAGAHAAAGCRWPFSGRSTAPPKQCAERSAGRSARADDTAGRVAQNLAQDRRRRAVRR